QSVELFEFFLTYTSKKNDFYKFALYLQAKAFYNMKEYDKAIKLLNEALEMDKNFKEALELLNQLQKENEG
ncbi:MAG: tetratricopeptide repeat protein, partial [Methanobacterium sp.]